jgi:hypothetical protein
VWAAQSEMSSMRRAEEQEAIIVVGVIRIEPGD